MYIFFFSLSIIYIYINLLDSAALYCTQPQSSVKSSAISMDQKPTQPETQRSYGPCNAAIGIIDEQRRGPRCRSCRSEPLEPADLKKGSTQILRL